MSILRVGIDSESFDAVKNACLNRNTTVLLDRDQTGSQKLALEELGDHALDLMRSEGVDRLGPGIGMFTSGSTALPKGVVYNWDLIEWLIDESLVQLAGGDARARTAAFSSPAFSAGFLRTLVSLAGPSVKVINPRSHSPRKILDKLREENIEQISLVPALIDSLYDECLKSGIRLRQAHTAYVFGEKLTWERVAKARRIISETGVVVARYATTEAPGGVLNFTVHPDQPLGKGLVPLGTPVYPSRVKLVAHESGDGALQIAIGEPLVQGYVDPEQTAQRFIFDEDGSRWWLSGDLAEVDDQGLYHFRGRADDVIKRRGELVGPLEAEIAIRSIPDVTDVAVLPTPFSSDDQHMVAHIVVDPRSAITPDQIMNSVFEEVGRSKSPDWLVRHENLPKTHRGKIDRRTLQDLSFEKWRVVTPEPDTMLGRGVLRIVQSVLHDPEIGFDTDLWAGGMDSLSALEIVVALEEWGLEDVEPALLVEWRTPRLLAKFLELAKRPRRSPLTTFHQDGGDESVFVFPGAATTAATFYPFAEALGKTHPLHVIDTHGLQRLAAENKTTEKQAIFAARVIERSGPKDPLLLVGHCAGGPLAYETARILTNRGFDVKLVLLNTVSEPPASWRPTSHRLAAFVRRIGKRLARASRTYRRIASETGARGREAEIPETPLERRKRAYVEAGNALIEMASQYRFTAPNFPVLLLTDSKKSAAAPLRRNIRAKTEQILGTKQNQLQAGQLEEVAEKVSQYLFSTEDSTGDAR